MTSRELLPGQQDATDLSANQVQFALVISRMLETVKDDADARRQMVYDLARYKLQEQFTYADARNIDQMKRALEVAIEEVEKFSREQAPLERLPQQQLASSKETGGVLMSGDATVLKSGIETSRGKLPAASGPLLPVIKRTAAILLAFGAVILIVSKRDNIAALRRQIASQPAEIAQVTPRPETTIAVAKPEMVTPAAPAPTRVLPTDYGIHALIDDKSLAELTATGVMAPDMRIAISPEFRKPDRPHLPNGRVKFIVFRRDVASAIPERVEVRLVAKIAREFSSDAAGKALAGGDDVGVIRNFAYPFRASPIPGKAEMYELHTGDSELELPPGHYVLSLGAQAYYFQVDGEITDPRQCLERVVAGNGTFYAPCKKAKAY
ncbi:hypothetical protein A5906_17165 [Bradyrhizobium sacchari]|uniref:Uncharacterized protein n=1 Tax=Bradyrhizobium sacchari TaxID=1399419 RepID=A0A560JMC4_9BRAD|nr:hypothetical protein [Bradyrhizobium sacchari]OPY93818.1 hypothetical protein A5906_17165 [Bradyrhizobium sacchari]TWB59318.1 hypothetical protein FBZ94_105594 [Bradyrhizobium sacchari]TWB72322.1 hypothetical protein FBZ95_10637 [Bradyrhizobium sacchari]